MSESNTEGAVLELSAEASAKILYFFRRAAICRAMQWDAEFQIELLLKEITGDEDVEIDTDFQHWAAALEVSLDAREPVEVLAGVIGIEDLNIEFEGTYKFVDGAPPPLQRFTCIGHWTGEADSPIVHVVEAADGAEAIAAHVKAALVSRGFDEDSHLGEGFINTFVFVGEPELFSSWAG